MTLQDILEGIRPADKKAEELARTRWNSLAMPLGSLGQLAEAVVRVAGVTGEPSVRLERRSLLVLCADNGVVARGVSQSDASVTAAVAKALGAGFSTASYLARDARCAVRPVDIGMRPHETFSGVEDFSIGPGTADIAAGPAMTEEECARAIEAGIELVRREKEAGTDILLVGEMGIGNTTTSCAVACALLGREPVELAGRGAGLSAEGLERKIAVLETALAVNRPDPKDPVDVLRKVGGFDLAGLCGICLGGAYYRIPVLLDGLITCAAALCAVRLCPEAQNALLASHVSAEPAARLLLEALGLEAPMAAGLRLGEGSGALAALKLLDAALSVYNSGHTFGHLGIEAYVEL